MKKRNKTTNIMIDEEIEPPEYTYYVNCLRKVTGGEAKNPEKKFSDRFPRYERTEFLSVSNAPSKDVKFYEFFNSKNDITKEKEVYIIAVIYSDGDTFGTYHGNVQIWSVHSSLEEAEKEMTDIPESKEWKAWEGYFSSLEEMKIVKLPYVHQNINNE